MSEYIPGQRLEIRGEEWLLRRVDWTRNHARLDVVGVSSLVRDREAFFLADVEEAAGCIRIIDPAETQAVADESPHCLNARLHLETLVRATAPDDGGIHLGHRAAMDVLDYQLEPAMQALSRPRARILIADAVGLGKTLECGILLTELMKRGRCRRLLVVTVKSMLEQFQREMWGRFSIPLTRLDSEAIRRIRYNIPSNQNPFHYYDKSIISVDTLKTQEYQSYLRTAHWDAIVIDEAHNVASRATTSQRYALARELSARCDSLILMSATPHDGRQAPFASIVELLEPTAVIAGGAAPQDISELYIRRLKRDVPQGAFLERTTSSRVSVPTAEERAVYEAIGDLHLQMDEDGPPAVCGHLFRTLIAKSYASSPAACSSLLEHRLEKLHASTPTHPDIPALHALKSLVDNVDAGVFSKYRELVEGLKTGGWLGWNRAADDRIVIFTESIPTLDFLAAHLPGDLGLRYNAKDKTGANQVARMDGGMKDVEQMEIVKAFGDPTSPLRVLLVSDVASEGINLHPCAHRLIHFDIPWSLLTLQQRNGRIDRYGQRQRPEIHYLLCGDTDCSCLGDAHVLGILISKDEEVSRTIGDPREFALLADAGVGVSDEEIIGGIIERNGKAAAGELAEALASPEEVPAPPRSAPRAVDVRRDCSLFADDGTYGRALFEYARQRGGGTETWHAEEQGGALVLDGLPADFYQGWLQRRFPGVYGPDSRWVLTPDRTAVCRHLAAGNGWPSVQLLWEQHPVVQYLAGKLLAAFPRNTAPVIGSAALTPDERIVLGLATISNKCGGLLMRRWVGVLFHGEEPEPELLDLQDVVGKCHLDDSQVLSPVPPSQNAPLSRDLIRKAVGIIGFAVQRHATERTAVWRTELDRRLAQLDAYREGGLTQLAAGLAADKRPPALARKDYDAKCEAVLRRYGQTSQQLRDSLIGNGKPTIRITTLFASTLPQA